MTAPLVVGNWKMNGGPASCIALAREIVRHTRKNHNSVQVALAPPFISLLPVKKIIGKSSIKLAAQNCHWEESGAFTGEISPPMLAEVGCDFVIIGHSERRHVFGESNRMIAQKLLAVTRHGMRAILCVGETLEERQADKTSAVIEHQLDSALKGISEGDIDKLEIAYEPVWAIGTGVNATVEQIHDTHSQIRGLLIGRFGETNGSQVRILYGGSVKPENAPMLARVESANGVLVGGASLDPQSFREILQAFKSERIL